MRNYGKGLMCMLAVRSINNNTVICKDCSGQEIIAMGKGIGFGKLPREIPLQQIDRTFYDVASRYQPLLCELPAEVLDFTGKIVEIARNELPYELSPNLVITLADHINFAIERARNNIRVKMPVPYDVKQSFPVEYNIGKYTVNRIRKEFKIGLLEEEAVGIAMGLLNAKITEEARVCEESMQDEEMLEDITEMIENVFHIMIDRESFNYSRYATHLQYLFQRIHSGTAISSDNLQMYKSLREEFPDIASCVECIVHHMEEKWKCELSEEEKLYLMLHINRICTKEGV